MSLTWSRQPKAESTVRYCTEPLEPIADEDEVFFAQQYQLPGWVAREFIKVAPETQRYALPIYAPDRSQRGIVLRMPWLGAPRMARGVRLKADTYKSRPGPLQSHYSGQRASAEYPPPYVVVVEDQLSAIKLAAYGLDSVALLGVPDVYPSGYSGVDRVTEIARRAAGREVIVALDSDATETALLFAKKWQAMFVRLRVAILARDLKDEDAANFSEVLGV